MSDHIRELRTEMAKRGAALFTAVTSDAHGSEYISDHDNAVEFISGFTGDNGKLAVTMDEALLWVDGRFFIQAADELAGSEIKMMKTGEPGVPEYKAWVGSETEKIKNTDGRNGESSDADGRTGIQGTAVITPDSPDYEDIVNEIWKDRPARPANPIWIHDIKWAGKTAKEKLDQVRKCMEERGLEEIYVRALDDIAWVLNLRGSDIPYNPVFYAFLHIRNRQDRNAPENRTDGKTAAGPQDSADITVYLQPESLSDEIRNYLSDLGIEIAEYADFKPEAGFSTIIAEIKNRKTGSELRYMHDCGLRDGVYMTKYIYWLKQQMRNGADIDEIDASNHLDALRASDDKYVSLSFPTISAYGSNAAIVHYRASEATKKKLEPHGLYLVDSGGHYLDGTTDVTRTVVLGELTAEEREHYTLVCMGMLRVLNRTFTLPLDSIIIDKCAREPLRDHGLDFNHSTGHGVGFCGYVHESPARIARSPRPTDAKQAQAAAAQTTTAQTTAQQTAPAQPQTPPPYVFTGCETVSDEPGVYIEGSHGIRIENMIAVGSDRFENLTWVPLEREAIDWSLMTEEDKTNFENYQQAVKDMISPYLNDDERAWLSGQ